MRILGDRMKWLRENKRLSQKEVAIDLGLSLNGYQKIEYDESNPKIDTLINIAKYYKVSTDFLLGLSNQMSNDDEGIKIKLEIFAIKSKIKERQQSLLRERTELDYAKSEQIQIFEMTNKYDVNSIDYQIAEQRNLNLNDYIKKKKSQIVFLQHEIDELERRHRFKIGDYFKYLSKIPYPDVVSDEIIKDLLPVEIKVNSIFDRHYVEVFGNNGINFTYSSDSIPIEEAEEERMKLMNIFCNG